MGDHGVTQVEQLTTTIFNEVMDAVVRHWVSVMAEGAEERGERGQEGRHQNALFYVEDGMIASSELQWLQGAFSTLVGLFDMMGLRTNVGKTVRMIFHLCQAVGNQSEVRMGSG